MAERDPPGHDAQAPTLPLPSSVYLLVVPFSDGLSLLIDERIAIPGWELLHGVDALLAEVVAGRNLVRHWMRLCVAMTLGAALYGAVLGLWHGPRLAFYDALKLPLVLLLTSALTVGFAWTAAVVLGLPLRFGQVAVLTFLALAAGSLRSEEHTSEL